MAFATVTVHVVNNAPVAVADRATVQSNSSATINIGANDYDPDGDRFFARLVRGPAHGTGSIVNETQFSYRYAPDMYGKCDATSDSILYELVDEHGLVSDQAVTLSISINC